MTVSKVMKEIEKDILFFDESGGGATFSGGEPLSRPDFLEALLRACRDKEIHTVVDTTGYAPRSVLERTSPLIDLFLFDLKLLDDDKHRRFTGVSNKRILSNLRLLSNQDRNVIIRVPIIPGITDGKENIIKIGRLVKSLGNIRQIDLLAYHAMAADKYHRLHQDYVLQDINPPSQERMKDLANILKNMNFTVTIGG